MKAKSNKCPRCKIRNKTSGGYCKECRRDYNRSRYADVKTERTLASLLGPDFKVPDDSDSAVWASQSDGSEGDVIGGVVFDGNPELDEVITVILRAVSQIVRKSMYEMGTVLAQVINAELKPYVKLVAERDPGSGGTLLEDSDDTES